MVLNLEFTFSKKSVFELFYTDNCWGWITLKWLTSWDLLLRSNYFVYVVFADGLWKRHEKQRQTMTSTTRNKKLTKTYISYCRKVSCNIYGTRPVAHSSTIPVNSLMRWNHNIGKRTTGQENDNVLSAVVFG